MDTNGLNVRRLTYAHEQATDPAWSPQGDRIAYTGRVERRNRVCILDLASGDESCLPPVGSGEEGPAWSPDGNHLAFIARKGGTITLHLQRADGRGEAWPVYLRGEPKTPSWYR
jgi:TolB protein